MSGIMTFAVNQQGIVFQKDLAKSTPRIAAAMTCYDSDYSWQPADRVQSPLRSAPFGRLVYRVISRAMTTAM